MNILENLKYTNEHEWVRVEEDGTVVVGITDFAQGELGELVYVEVESVGETIDKDEVFGTVEAVKTTSDLFYPYGAGWLVKIKPSDESELEGLLSPEDYKSMIS